MKKYKLEVTVFLCGAISMLLEVLAARVLSPYVGSSNVTWTSIIGVILISMSLGYYIGGKIADKNPNKEVLALLILIATFFTSLIPIIEVVIVDNLAKMDINLTFVAILCAIITFSIPSFVLATVSPYAVKLKTENNNEDNLGKISGGLSSLSTIGSIVGTFAGGFVLIPNFGVRNIVFGVTIVLLILSILLSKRESWKTYIKHAIILILIIIDFFIGKSLFENKNKDIIADIDSQYSRLWIKQIEVGEKNYQTLQVDTGIESYIDKETGEMGALYLYYYDLFDYYNKNAQNTLLIGGAAYTYPKHYLQKYEDKTIDVSEIDEKMTEVAYEYFDLYDDERLRNYHQDGRTYLNNSENKYDVILLDAFKGVNAPFELTTKEAMISAKNIMNDNGMIITNIISSLEGEESDFIKYEYATYKEVFDDVKVFKVSGKRDNSERQNLILIGFKGNSNINFDKEEEYKYLLENEVTDFTSDAQIVTDDFAPIGT